MFVIFTRPVILNIHHSGMRRVFTGLLLLCSIMVVPLASHATTSSLAQRLKGRLLLQVQDHGQAWYVNPDDGLRYYLKDGDAAYRLMSSLGLGISNRDLAVIPSVRQPEDMSSRASVCGSNTLAERVKGKILLQVHAAGEAWYVDPTSCYRVYLKNGDEAYRIMRVLSLGITNQDLATIPVSSAIESLAQVAGEKTLVTLAVPKVDGENPFSGATLYRYTSTNAADQAEEWASYRSTDAVAMRYLADQPTARWFGDWNDDIQDDVNDYMSKADDLQSLPVIVAYNIPDRDCGGGYSAGGVKSAQSYHDWVVGMANGIGTRRAIVILEPDGIALDCFNDERGAMLTDAVKVLEAKPNVSVYIDAGHPNWTPASIMAARLQKSGIAYAQGFALNVSNFYTTESNIAFGNDLSSRLAGKHYIIDTSRNANGWTGHWCNPQAAGIGARPTTNTGVPLYDAGLWVKSPGGSDGNCNGGPDAGHWWPDYGLKLYYQGTHE